MGKENWLDRFLIAWTVNIIGLFLAAIIIPGINYPVGMWWVVVLAAFVFAVINFFIKPIILFLAIPTILITFGLFYFVVNGFMLYLTSVFVPVFEIQSFWDAVFGALIISLVNLIVNLFIGGDKKFDINIKKV